MMRCLKLRQSGCRNQKRTLEEKGIKHSKGEGSYAVISQKQSLSRVMVAIFCTGPRMLT